MDLTVLAEDFWGDLSITLFLIKMNEKKNLLPFGSPERRKEFSILHSQQHLFVLKRSSCESNEA